jgi:hypothetical protein
MYSELKCNLSLVPANLNLLQNRPMREIEFSDSLKIGGFSAFDLLGNGRFYLLDIPGVSDLEAFFGCNLSIPTAKFFQHTIGHMCGLARTWPSEFIFLGGDICHFPGMFRPPVASGSSDKTGTIPSSVEHVDSMCCAMPSHQQLLYDVADGRTSVHHNPDVARLSISKSTSFDANDDVFVRIAHDKSLVENIPAINHVGNETSEITDWKKKGYKELCKWGYSKEIPSNTRGMLSVES